MSIKSNSSDTRASREALDWLIILQENPHDTEQQARFNAWHQRCPENGAAWREAQRVGNLLSDLHALTETSLREPNAALAEPSPTRRHRFAWSAGLSLAAVALCMLLSAPAFNIWLAKDYATATAENRPIQLDDGSMLHLGADSAISIDFEPTVRRVRLLAGEAYFEVQPDKSRPFRVDAGQVEISVLGTAFDVRISDDTVKIAVNHGRVQVDAPVADPRLEAPLLAGDWVSITGRQQIKRGNDAPELVASWRSGKLIVKNRPIGEVIDDIRRHYHGAIILTDKTVAGHRITGMYDLSMPVEALRAIAQTQGGQVRQISPWVTFISMH
ncbi:FecR family protein [Biostraticola tofi]|uniref:FecR family protein n=1 Tax=Biostraticola tofi TaxID=466109 RepID=A0A4V2W545_9GAMM|nr:FecR family protein [Biostraticola tofi]TCV98349.1 FecR family protein [Biostraticola tofi]